VGIGDSPDDRETEPVPAAALVPVAGLDPLDPEPLERLEQTIYLVGRISGPVLHTDTTARPSRVAVDTRAQPPGML
jgi:hypothetical protein